MQDENGGKPPLKFTTVMGLLIAFSLPFRSLLCKPGTVGRRMFNPWSVGLALGAPLIWAGLVQSLWMWVVLLLALVGVGTQLRWKGGHSYDMGESRWGPKVDVCVLLVAGLVLCYLDPYAGGYLLAATAGDFATKWWAQKKAEEVDQDLIDAQLEAKSRAIRVRNRT